MPHEVPQEVSFYLPDMLPQWPWPRSINSFYEEAKKESAEWCESFKAFSPKAQKAFNLCDFNGCRIGCDLMNLFFVIDEHSDLADGPTARHQLDCVMDALRNPHKARPEGDWIGGAITQSYWLNAMRTATPIAQKRFIESFKDWTDSVVQQAYDRDDNRIRDIAGYLKLRRDTIGALPSFIILQAHLNIPDEVMENPVIRELTALCTDIIIIGNDLCSWPNEQARGDKHNLIAIVMHELGVDLDGAVRWMTDWNDRLVAEFLELWDHIPTYRGPLDLEVRTYIDGIANWARASEQWNFESGRYFGREGLNIQRTRKVTFRKARA
ncbi:terpenoid synthase [Mycena galopus ATCC 62051]|nr:terpenoid synthase [Mycena galopus ATCC 62051]